MLNEKSKMHTRVYKISFFERKKKIYAYLSTMCSVYQRVSRVVLSWFPWGWGVRKCEPWLWGQTAFWSNFVTSGVTTESSTVFMEHFLYARLAQQLMIQQYRCYFCDFPGGLVVKNTPSRGGRWERGLGWGTHVNPWLIHVNVWQNPLQYCKVISLQLIKINNKKKSTIQCRGRRFQTWSGN